MQDMQESGAEETPVEGLLQELRQGSEEWRTARLGRVTASRVADVIAKTKSGTAATRANYLAELVVERMTMQPSDRFCNDAMRWGTEKEPEARAAYEFFERYTVTPVGFVPHPYIEMSGASPDGLVGDLGLVEIKCPSSRVHIETLLGRAVPGKYVTQIQWQLACTGRAWCDFVSFDPRMPEDMKLFTKRVAREDKVIAELEDAVRLFLAEVSDTVARLEKLYRQEAA